MGKGKVVIKVLLGFHASGAEALTMPLLFSYGTLRDPATQRAVFGREVAEDGDELLGFVREVIEVQDPAFIVRKGAIHAIVRQTGRDDDRTPGAVLELTDGELAMADAYEPAEYRRVEARFASGRRGWVYAALDAAPSE